MKLNLNVANVATWLVLIYAVLGAAVVILSAAGSVHDRDLALSFNAYLESMAVAVAGLAIGRGLNAVNRP